MKQIEDLFQRMINRHLKFDYVAALKRHCKSKTKGRKLDMTQYMDDDFVHMSETIHQTQQKDLVLATQLSKQSHDIVPYRQDIRGPPCFQDLQCSHSEVCL